MRIDTQKHTHKNCVCIVSEYIYIWQKYKVRNWKDTC